MQLNIVLVEPEIPQNTGNIARTCAATGSRLHIVKPMGFTIDDRKLKRAGLDYWHLLDITYYENLADFFEKNAGGKFFYFSTKAEHIHSDVVYPNNAYIVFGKETKGLPEELLHDNPDSCVRIPMIMLMYGREAQSKTRIASPATIPKSGERNRKIHSCMLYLISI